MLSLIPSSPHPFSLSIRMQAARYSAADAARLVSRCYLHPFFGLQDTVPVADPFGTVRVTV
jgi:hypothetical protein